MRKLIVPLFLFVMVLVMTLPSCTPDPVATPPVMQVTPSSPVTAKPGAALNYEVMISSDTDLKKVEMTAKLDATVLFTTDSTFPAGAQAAIVNFSFTVPNSVSAGSVISLEFLATNDGSSKLITTTITVEAGEINTYTAVIMSDLENPDGSSFYSLEDNKLMTLSQADVASGEVDLIYYYGATNKATLCAPDDQDIRAFTDSHGAVVVDRLEVMNDTRIGMVEMAVADFNAVTNDGPILAKKPATTSTAANNLVKDKVIYCETVTGKKALVLVKNITGTQGTSYITIEVKVQK
jgi:hypothetical protein